MLSSIIAHRTATPANSLAARCDRTIAFVEG